jgi:glutamine cyclotransferase
MGDPAEQTGEHCGAMIIKTSANILSLVIISFLFLSRSAFPETLVLEKAKDYEAKIPVRVVKEFPLPEGYHEGLFFNNGRIWVNNGKGGRTWLVDTDSGSVVFEIKPVGTFAEGITTKGDGAFWLTDWDEKKLYRVRIKGSEMIPEYEMSLAPAHPTGVAWADEKLYMITWTKGIGTKYHLMQLDKEGNIVQKIRIKRIHEPAHLTWDGRHLWITSWYNQLVYKVDINTLRIMGSFRSPAPKTTGIAWDGECFWITGTYAGLYRVEVLDKGYSR